MMGTLMASEAAEFCGGIIYGPDREICGQWRSDNRDVERGDVFAALCGEKTDGHLFVKNAIERGASMVLVNCDKVGALELDRYALPRGVTVIAVPETSAALSRIARAYLGRVAPHVLGITGSVGKTTTRELAMAVLRRKFKVHGAIRSFNTIIGCSLTVLSMPPETDILVLELGTNHFGEITEMTSYFPPETAVITEVAPAHLAGFGSVNGVLRAKMEICGQQGLKNVIYNYDNELLRDALKEKDGTLKLTGVGQQAGASMHLSEISTSFGCSGAMVSVRCTGEGMDSVVRTPLFGRQHAYNIGFAVSAARLYGVPEDDIKAAFANAKQIGGRGVCERTSRGGWLIDETYNANPSSMRAALENACGAADKGGMKKYAVLGGMRELGADSPQWHMEMLPLAAKFDKVFLLGDEWKGLKLPECAKLFRNFDELASALCKIDSSGSVILIKGSNSYGLKRLIQMIRGDEDVH